MNNRENIKKVIDLLTELMARENTPLVDVNWECEYQYLTFDPSFDKSFQVPIAADIELRLKYSDHVVDKPREIL